MKNLFSSLIVAILLLGWTLWPREALSHGAVTTTVLFDREIVRILNDRCVGCHMERGISFPLSTYEETWLRRGAIRTEVLRRHMPPWPAVAGYGRFANENGLTPREMQFLVSWVEGLGPRNAGTVFLNVSDPQSPLRQEVRAAAHVAHWQLGEPDLVRALPANLVRGLVPNLAPNLTPQQRDFVQRAVIDLDLSSARRLRALEYRPGDRRVVRAATFRLEKTGQWLGSWTPWYGFTRLPKDVAHLLPPGSRLIAEIHYRASSEPVFDRGSIGLFFADGQARTPAPDLMMETTRARGGNALHAMTQLRTDTVVWALNPEIVAGLTSLEVSALRSDGGTDVLLFARDPRAEWPTPYILSEPILLRRGTQLSVVARTADRAPRPDRIRVRVARY